MEDVLNKPQKFSTSISINPSSVHKLNPEFSLCDIDVMYVDDNRNGSNISKEVVTEGLYSMYGVPIVGEWLEEKQRFGDHGQKIEITDEGIKFTVTTKPLGFVTKEAVEGATWVKKKLPNGHEEKEWLHLENCILWTARYEEAQHIITDGTNQSMECKFPKGHYNNDNIFVAEQVVFSALCAIGVEPCFEESNISRHYALDNFKEEFALAEKELKNSKESTPEGEDHKDHGKGCFASETVTKKGDHAEMNLELIEKALSTYKCKDILDGTEVNKYSIVDATEDKLILADNEKMSVLSVEYALKEEEVVFDWESAVEKHSSFRVYEALVAEKESSEKSIDVLHTEYESKYTQMTEAYETLAESFRVADADLQKYKLAEAEALKEEHKAKVNEVVEKYEAKIGKYPKFLVYKAKLNAEEVNIEDVEKDLALMAGHVMIEGKNGAKDSFSYNPVATGVNVNSAYAKDDKHYGSLLDKFRK